MRGNFEKRVSVVMFFMVALLIFTGSLASGATKGSAVRNLDKGSYCHLERPEQVAVNGEADWKALWERVSAGRLPKSSPPEVDFSHETAIAVFMGQKNSGGYGVEVVSLVKDGDETVITYRERVPAEGMMVSMAVTSPYHIVAVPKVTGKVIFKRI